ncbi:MAG: endopeptidase La [Holosporales bacterium]|jgi:ATP-dependent Lon protease|nr:endopeptidase La [Holosporales bacterium]
MEHLQLNQLQKLHKITGYFMNDTKKEEKPSKETTYRLPVLPLRDIVVFPHMIVPLFVGRERSIHSLESIVEKEEKRVLLSTQKDSQKDSPEPQDIFDIGTVSTVLQMLRLPDGTVKILVEGLYRGRIVHCTDLSTHYEAEIEKISETLSKEKEMFALMRTLTDQFEVYVKLHRRIPFEVVTALRQETLPGRLADIIASHLFLRVPDKQRLLETQDLSKRLELVFSYLETEVGVMQVERRIRSRIKRQMEKTQRDYYLNEQIKAIQHELGESESAGSEFDELASKLKTVKLSKEAHERATLELKKLQSMAPMSAEATVIRNYLDCLLSVPWGKVTKVNKNLKRAQEILDTDHYGLKKVKDRILEYLAVQSRVEKVSGQVLCLVGPPGVGKTSLARSIAKATGRTFVRISLGGVHDESEIRGHRRTYIGSMPGKIIQGMRKAGVTNPLFLLDEIDKLGNDFRGDPASALLEVLDPEQNTAFNDHYLEVDYDLSNVMFLTTANSLHMAQPLLDRLEIIRLAGYTEDEKVAIAQTYLVPKQRKLNGLKEREISVSKDAIRNIVRFYTREAGVRNLEREIANFARKAVRKILEEEDKKSTQRIHITRRNLKEFAGIPRFTIGEAEGSDLIGVTTGLAWTEVGGELLSIEAVVLPGKGKMLITGKLGDVMQESIQAAASFVRSQSEKYAIDPELFEKKDIHIHVPEGATPKDGPSAGVAMATSIVSALTGIPVRKDIAMTGEITLRGRILPIGGLKEKILAAHRGNIRTIFIPKDNEKDLEEIPENIRKGVTIVPVLFVNDVLEQALVRSLVPQKKSPHKPVGSFSSEPHVGV